MSELHMTISKEQREVLEDCPHLHPFSFLDDGDLLVVEDAGAANPAVETSSLVAWTVWILTRDGTIQSIMDHIELRHDYLKEKPGLREFHLEHTSQVDAPRIIDGNQASQYLLLKYRVNVTPRTIRNWLRDGRVVGAQLGDAERAPWYTTHNALDLATKRDWFPDPDPDAPDLIELERRPVGGLSEDVTAQTGDNGEQPQHTDQGSSTSSQDADQQHPPQDAV